MNNLQDLVTSGVENIQAEEKLLPPLEVKGSVSSDQLERVIDHFESTISSCSPEEVPYWTAQLVAYSSHCGLGVVPRVHKNYHMLAASYSYEPKQEYLDHLLEWSSDLRKAIEEKRKQAAQDSVIGNGDSQLDFLGEFFGDDLAKELAELTNVKEATVRRWIRSGLSSSWHNHMVVKSCARVFYALRYSYGIDKDEALEWYRSPWRENSPSAREMLQSGSLYYGRSSEFEEMIKSISTEKE